MHLPDDLRNRLASEFRFAADMMKETADPFRQLYFFSAFYGESARVLNWAWDRDLALIHNVCQHAYQQINANVGAAASGNERAVRIPDGLLEKLTQLVDELTDWVSKNQKAGDKNLVSILSRLAELAYVSTGNGYYLHTRGSITI